MKFAENIKHWNNGLNEVLEFQNGSDRKGYSIVDDLILIDFSADSTSKEATLKCKDPRSNEIVLITFSGVDRALFAPENTFEKYNVHDEATDFSVIDQIVYDPDHTESEMTVTIIGFGWIIAFTATGVRMAIKDN